MYVYVLVHSFLHIRQILGTRSGNDGFPAHCAASNWSLRLCHFTLTQIDGCFEPQHYSYIQ